MSHQILAVLEYMEKEKGIPRDEMIRAISDAIVFAAQKGVNAGQRIEVSINPKTGALRAYAVLQVVDSLENSLREIHIRRAQELDPKAELGDLVRREIDPAFLGRIAAQAARQAINQSVKQHERMRVYEEYRDQIGKIVNGVVRRKETRELRDQEDRVAVDLIVEVGKTEAILAQRDIIPGESYRVGDRVRALLVGINTHDQAQGPLLVISRTSPKFILALLRLEVAEIADGSVEIVHFVREPGYRTKIAVTARDPHVDPVGACVGARGVRVKNIVKELAGEKLDIIRHNPDLLKFLAEALKPTVPQNVRIDEENQRIHFEVPESDLALVIGKRGSNARLLSRLLNWHLDIRVKDSDQSNFDLNRQHALEDLSRLEGLDRDLAIRLVEIGITGFDAFEGVTVADLVSAGFDMGEAVKVIDCYKQFCKQSRMEPEEQKS